MAATFAAIVGSLCIGAYPLSFRQAGRILAHLAWPGPLPDPPPWTLKEQAVVQIIRLPRVLLATFAGMALGLSGTALQGMMRNPLVGPDLVGVTAGAAFGGVMAILFHLPPPAVVGCAFAGGLAAMACVFGLTSLVRGSTDGMVLVLAGIFIGAFFMAGVGVGQFFADDGALAKMTNWLLGTLAHADPQAVWTLAVPTLIGGALLMALRWRLNLLSLGDLDAASLGVPVRLLRLAIVALVSLIVAAQVSVSGVVAWVGLVVPHIARMLVGPDHRRLLPASALIGALFTLGLDDFTRTVLKADVPIGVLTALIGTPLLGFLFWKRQTKGWIDD